MTSQQHDSDEGKESVEYNNMLVIPEWETRFGADDFVDVSTVATKHRLLNVPIVEALFSPKYRPKTSTTTPSLYESEANKRKRPSTTSASRPSRVNKGAKLTKQETTHTIQTRLESKDTVTDRNATGDLEVQSIVGLSDEQVQLLEHMDQCRREDSNKYRAAFQQFDSDGSGDISIAELSQVLKSLDPELSQDDINEISTQSDKDGDGTINYEEFVSMMQARKRLNAMANALTSTKSTTRVSSKISSEATSATLNSSIIAFPPADLGVLSHLHAKTALPPLRLERSRLCTTRGKNKKLYQSKKRRIQNSIRLKRLNRPRRNTRQSAKPRQSQRPETMAILKQRLENTKGNMTKIHNEMQQGMEWVQSNVPVQSVKAQLYCKKWGFAKLESIMKRIEYSFVISAWQNWQHFTEYTKKQEQISQYMKLKGSKRLTSLFENWKRKQVLRAWSTWAQICTSGQRMEREAASRQVQRVFRGFVGKGLAAQRKRDLAAIQIQNMARRRIARKRVNRMRQVRKRNTAALAIQCTFRKYLAKKTLIQVRFQLLCDKSARVIQRAWRAHVDKRLATALYREFIQVTSATHIQRVFRGYMSRLESSTRRDAIAQIIASCVIQVNFRGYLGRRIGKYLVQQRVATIAMDEAALQIQCWYRGLNFRYDYMVKKRNRASSKLQRWWKQNKGRRLRLLEERKRKQRDVASVRLQCWFRQLKSTWLVRRMQLERYAVRDMQRIVRGHLGRLRVIAIAKAIEVQRELELQRKYDSACNIQKVIRGRIARNFVQQVRIDYWIQNTIREVFHVATCNIAKKIVPQVLQDYPVEQSNVEYSELVVLDGESEVAVVMGWMLDQVSGEAQFDHQLSRSNTVSSQSRPSTASSHSKQSRPGTASSHSKQSRPGTASSHSKQSRPGTASSHSKQSRPGTASSHSEQVRPGTASSHSKQSRPGTASSHLEQSRPGTASSHSEQVRPGTASSHSEQSRPGTASSHSKQSRPGTAHSEQSRPGTAHSEQSRPGTAHSEQSRPGTAHSEQSRPGTAVSHAQQSRPSSASSQQLARPGTAASEPLQAHSSLVSRIQRTGSSQSQPVNEANEFELRLQAGSPLEAINAQNTAGATKESEESSQFVVHPLQTDQQDGILVPASPSTAAAGAILAGRFLGEGNTRMPSGKIDIDDPDNSTVFQDLKVDDMLELNHEVIVSDTQVNASIRIQSCTRGMLDRMRVKQHKAAAANGLQKLKQMESDSNDQHIKQVAAIRIQATLRTKLANKQVDKMREQHQLLEKQLIEEEENFAKQKAATMLQSLARRKAAQKQRQRKIAARLARKVENKDATNKILGHKLHYSVYTGGATIVYHVETKLGDNEVKSRWMRRESITAPTSGIHESCIQAYEGDHWDELQKDTGLHVDEEFQDALISTELEDEMATNLESEELLIWDEFESPEIRYIKEASAITIQATMRAFLDRVRLNRSIETRKMLQDQQTKIVFTEASLKIQVWYRCHRDRKRLNQMKQAKDAAKQAEQERNEKAMIERARRDAIAKSGAAARIQLFYRRIKAQRLVQSLREQDIRRKELAALQEKARLLREERQSEAAIRIQCAFRVREANRVVNRKRTEYQDYLRKLREDADRKCEMKELQQRQMREIAAIKVQNCFRCRKARQMFMQKSKELKRKQALEAREQVRAAKATVAVKLQAQYRGYKAREKVMKLLDERDNVLHGQMQQQQQQLQLQLQMQQQQQMMMIAALANNNQPQMYPATNTFAAAAPQQYTSAQVVPDAGQWAEYWDDASNSYYYYNTVTQETRWDDPRVQAWHGGTDTTSSGYDTAGQYGGYSAGGASDWQEYYDDSSQLPYYYNSATGETSWDRPY